MKASLKSTGILSVMLILSESQTEKRTHNTTVDVDAVVAVAVTVAELVVGQN